MQAKLARKISLNFILFIILVFILNNISSFAVYIYSLNDTSKPVATLYYKFKYLTNAPSASNDTLKLDPNQIKYMVGTMQTFKQNGAVSSQIKVNKTIDYNHIYSLLIPLGNPAIISLETHNNMSYIPPLTNNIYPDKRIILFSISLILVLNVILIIFCQFIKLVWNGIDKLLFTELAERVKPGARYLSIITGIGLFIISVSLIEYLYFSQQIMHGVFNSDTLFLYQIFDKMRFGVKISEWYLNGAPNFFPDYLFFGFIYLFTHNYYIIIALVFLIQVTATFLSLIYFYKAILDTRRAIFCAGIVILCLSISIIIQPEPFGLVFLTLYHYGTLVATVLLLGLTLRVFKQNNYSYHIIGFILCALVTFSDISLLVWFLIPAVTSATIVCILWRKYTKRIAVFLLVNCCGAILGAKAYSWIGLLHSGRPAANLIPFNFGVIARKLIFFVNYFHSSYLALSILILIWCLCIVINIIFIRHKSDQPKLIFLLTFYTVLFPFLIAIEFMIDKLDFNNRYNLPVYFYSLVLFALVFVINNKPVKTLCLLIIIIFSVYAIKPMKILPIQKQYVSNEITCITNIIDKYNLTDGIAPYWDARYIEVVSNRPINIMAVNGNDLSPLFFLSYERKFHSNYNFAVIATNEKDPLFHINEELLYKLRGKPLHSFMCGDIKIVILAAKK